MKIRKIVIHLSIVFFCISGYAEEYLIDGDLNVVSNLVVSGSIAEGRETKAEAVFSHAEGFRSSASGAGAHAQGVLTLASAPFSHAEGCRTEASANFAHAEGMYSKASGFASHAAGERTTAGGRGSYAGGILANAEHDYTFVWSGSDTQSSEIYSTTNRQFIVYAPNGIYMLGSPIVGDGSALTNLLCEPSGGLSMGSFTNRP